MAEHSTLTAVLDNAQVPQQPLVIIVDSAVFSGLPVFREALVRALGRGGNVLLITALHQSSYLVSPTSKPPKIIDLRDSIPEYSDEQVDLEGRIRSAITPTLQVFIDAIDIIADDHSPLTAFKLVRSILKSLKPPGRLTLLLPHTCAFLDYLIPPSFSPALTLLYPVHPNVMEHLSRAYLMPISSDPAFWEMLDKARNRRLGEQIAYAGSEGVDVLGDWEKVPLRGAVMQVLVRKATGGTKGISRTLSALVPTSTGLSPVPVSDLVAINPVDAPTGEGVERPPTTHVDLILPFNLSLTDEQKRRRGEVPVPYAHEGEGAGVEFGDEEDEDDEEI